MKARELIIDALQQILVQADEEPLEGSNAQTAIRTANRLFWRLAAEGVSFGYTEIDSLDDEITIPNGAEEGAVYLLALALAPQFGAIASEELKYNAKAGRQAMLNIAVSISPVNYPDTMPIGSGNEQAGYQDSHFYPDPDANISSENNGTILLEDDTEVA